VILLKGGGGSGFERQAAEEVELLESAVEGPGECGLVAGEKGQAVLLVADLLEDVGETVIRVSVLEPVVDFLGVADEAEVKDVGFDGYQPPKAPAGDGHGFHQVELDGRGGLKLLDVGFAERLIFLAGFGGQDGLMRAEAVTEAVER
jgi:hypothetical protein